MTTGSASSLLLDADVLIDISRPHPAALAWLATLPTLPDVAGIAALELVAGCRDGHELRKAERLLLGFQRRWPSESDLERALTIYLPLRLAHGIGMSDTMIAATGFSWRAYSMKSAAWHRYERHDDRCNSHWRRLDPGYPQCPTLPNHSGPDSRSTLCKIRRNNKDGLRSRMLKNDRSAGCLNTFRPACSNASRKERNRPLSFRIWS